MGVNRLQCPNCGAGVRPIEGKRLFDCPRCRSTLEYDDGIIRIYIEKRFIDEAELFKQKVELERIKDQKRRDLHELKKSALGVFVFFAVIALIVFYFAMRVHPGSQYDYRRLQYTDAKRRLESAGFWNVTCIPIEDIGASRAGEDGEVIEVHVNGTDNFYKIMFRWSKVEVYYHKMPANPPIKAPEDSGSRYNGWKLQDVVNKLSKLGFAEIYTQVEHDLDSVTDGRMGKVFNVTIAGETDWLENKSRKIFHRNDRVVIYYHDASETAQATPPEGNASLLAGMDFNLVKARFEEAGFTNIRLVEDKSLSFAGYTEGAVTKVTINGDTEWSYGIGGMLRATYRRNVPVIITYIPVDE